MYHYVKTFDRKLPYFNFLHKESFKKQIKFFENKFKINKIKDNDIFENNKILLTFDDGTKDHYWVANYLKKKNYKAIFFISTYPYKKKDFLDVHKLHLIFGKYKSSEIQEALKYLKIRNEKLKKNNLKKIKLYQIKSAKNNEELNKIKLKLQLNFYLKKGNKIIINKIFNYFFSKKEQGNLFKKFYLTKKELMYMKKMVMILGSHSYSHSVLSKLNFKDQLRDIKKNKNLLKKLFNFKTDFFCYPYGGKYSYNKNTKKILKDLNYKFAFSVDNTDYTFKNNKLEIPRYNCNYFKHGKIFKKK